MASLRHLNGMPLRLDRALLRVSGPDARPFLNNLLTQNLDRLDAAPNAYAALLSPQGKVLTDMIVWRDADGVLIEADPARAPDLLRRLTMYKLRAQVNVEAMEGAVLWSAERFDGAEADPRFPDGALGFRIVSTQGGDDGADAFNAHRIAVGAPDLAIDAQSEEVFALEALLDELNGVDFQKGCFVGQENVSRMKRRATTRKKFCPVTFDGAPPPFGAAVRAGEAEVGTVRSGIAGRALALVRLDRAQEHARMGHSLACEGRPIALDPPAWLLLPTQEDA